MNRTERRMILVLSAVVAGTILAPWANHVYGWMMAACVLLLYGVLRLNAWIIRRAQDDALWRRFDRERRWWQAQLEAKQRRR